MVVWHAWIWGPSVPCGDRGGSERVVVASSLTNSEPGEGVRGEHEGGGDGSEEDGAPRARASNAPTARGGG